MKRFRTSGILTTVGCLMLIAGVSYLYDGGSSVTRIVIFFWGGASFLLGFVSYLKVIPQTYALPFRQASSIAHIILVPIFVALIIYLSRESLFTYNMFGLLSSYFGLGSTVALLFLGYRGAKKLSNTK